MPRWRNGWIGGCVAGLITALAAAGVSAQDAGGASAPKVELPVDTTASIMTAGVLGDRYVSLQLGGEADTLKDGDVIDFTESAVVLERVLGKIVHNLGGGGGEKDEKEKEGEE